MKTDMKKYMGHLTNVMYFAIKIDLNEFKSVSIHRKSDIKLMGLARVF